MISILLDICVIVLLLAFISLVLYIHKKDLNAKYVKYKLTKSKDNDMLYISVIVNNTKLNMLLDTGSEYSFINKNVLDSLKKKPAINSIKHNEQLGIRGVSSELFIPVNSTAEVLLNFNKYLYLNEYMYIADLGENIDGVLGLDWLGKINAQINIPKCNLYISKAMIRRYDIRSYKK